MALSHPFVLLFASFATSDEAFASADALASAFIFSNLSEATILSVTRRSTMGFMPSGTFLAVAVFASFFIAGSFANSDAASMGFAETTEFFFFFEVFAGLSGACAPVPVLSCLTAEPTVGAEEPAHPPPPPPPEDDEDEEDEEPPPEDTDLVVTVKAALTVPTLSVADAWAEPVEADTTLTRTVSPAETVDHEVVNAALLTE